MAINIDDLERRILAQEMVLTQLLAHAQSKTGDLLGHLEHMFTAKGANTDTSDGTPDTIRHAHAIIAAAKKVAAVHDAKD